MNKKSLFIFLCLGAFSLKGSSMSDNTTTIATLKTSLNTFLDERDWHQFHNPRTNSMNISIEATELLEIFVLAIEEVAKRTEAKATALEKLLEELIREQRQVVKNKPATIRRYAHKHSKKNSLEAACAASKNEPSTNQKENQS